MDDKIIKRMEEVEIENQNILRDLKKSEQDMNRCNKKLSAF